jgi:hypothetical protein
MDPCFVLTEGQKKLRFKKESNSNDEEWNIFARQQQHRTNNTNCNSNSNNNSIFPNINDAIPHYSPSNNNYSYGTANNAGTIVECNNLISIEARQHNTPNNDNNNNSNTSNGKNLIDTQIEPNTKRRKYERTAIDT